MNQFEKEVANAQKAKANSLTLECHGVKDISSLGLLKDLKELSLEGPRDRKLRPALKDISPVASLSNLVQLSLSRLGVSNLTPLSSLQRLSSLEISYCNAITDLSPLASLKNLKYLKIHECNKLTDLSPLASLPNLEVLRISYCDAISDLRPLASLSNLRTLYIFACKKVKDITPLASLTDLDCLSLAYTRVKDLSPVSQLKELRELNLSGCQYIKDLTPLLALSYLDTLDLLDAKIKDFRPLCYLSCLHDMYGCLRLPDEESIVDVLPESSIVHLYRNAVGELHHDKGPALLTKEGLKLYYWNGIHIPESWIEKGVPSIKKVFLVENAELCKTACEMIGWEKVIEELGAKVIDENADPEIGTLLEVKFPITGRECFLKVRCGSGRECVIPVPQEMQTAHEANAWTWGLKAFEYHPEVRT